jgi:hypothetical protein
MGSLGKKTLCKSCATAPAVQALCKLGLAPASAQICARALGGLFPVGVQQIRIAVWQSWTLAGSRGKRAFSPPPWGLGEGEGVAPGAGWPLADVSMAGWGFLERAAGLVRDSSARPPDIQGGQNAKWDTRPAPVRKRDEKKERQGDEALSF